MKSDLDTLMQARNLDALIVFGNAEHNPPMYYFTGGGHVSHATIIKKRGEEPIYFHNDMERDEAAKSGLKCIPYSKYDYDDLYKKANKDALLTSAMRCEMMFKDAGVTAGRVGVYGTYDLGSIFGMLTQLQKLLPQLEFVGEPRDDSLFMRAMETKDESEVDRIRKMGKITTGVVEKVRAYLTSRDVRDDEVLLKEDGSPLTVGDVHSKIRLWVSEQGAELPSGFIFAIGRDAGVPHSAGNPSDLMRLGQTIVFDIYPAEAGGWRILLRFHAHMESGLRHAYHLSIVRSGQRDFRSTDGQLRLERGVQRLQQNDLRIFRVEGTSITAQHKSAGGRIRA
ncbi:MAG: aminopeptidase P family N-terminal domain-containing protein [Anaerolineales bacterium]